MRLVGLDDRAAHEGEVSPALIAAAIRGERDPLRVVWQAQRRWVAAVLMAHKPRQVDLEDLLQEVAMQFVRRIHELRDPASLRPWLRTVAINAAHASGRTLARRKRDATEHRPALASGGLHAAHEAPDGVASAREQVSKLMELAERLPEGYREPLLLRCLHGMSYRVIGQAMDLPESTIETRIARGRRMLRELAEQEMNAERRTSSGGAGGARAASGVGGGVGGGVKVERPVAIGRAGESEQSHEQ